MGKRSRKRGVPVAPLPSADRPARARAAAPVQPRARMDEAPKAAWSPFPLTELVILLAMVMLLVGFFSSGDGRKPFIVVGVVLASLAGGELAVREHFAGFRSHTTLLALLCGFAAGALSLVAGPPKAVVVAIALVVFGVAFPFLRRAFARRTGGVRFRA